MGEYNRKYWEDGTNYNQYILKELADCRKGAWLRQIQKWIGTEKKKHILDVGCGPGFFSCILAEAGHYVTGIDQSAGMLSYAERNAESLGVKPSFMQMDVHELCFDDESFDLIISRNVTWTLDDPKSVYEQFYKKLSPEGLILVYDANWHIPFYEPELMKEVRANEKWFSDTFGYESKVCNDDPGLYEDLPLSNTWRPKWDVDVLNEIGFREIHTDLNVSDSLYLDWEKHLYAATPLFEIAAKK